MGSYLTPTMRRVAADLRRGALNPETKKDPYADWSDEDLVYAYFQQNPHERAVRLDPESRTILDNKAMARGELVGTARGPGDDVRAVAQMLPQMPPELTVAEQLGEPPPSWWRPGISIAEGPELERTREELGIGGVSGKMGPDTVPQPDWQAQATGPILRTGANLGGMALGTAGGALVGHPFLGGAAGGSAASFAAEDWIQQVERDIGVREHLNPQAKYMEGLIGGINFPGLIGPVAGTGAKVALKNLGRRAAGNMLAGAAVSGPAAYLLNAGEALNYGHVPTPEENLRAGAMGAAMGGVAGPVIGEAAHQGMRAVGAGARGASAVARAATRKLRGTNAPQLPSNEVLAAAARQLNADPRFTSPEYLAANGGRYSHPLIGTFEWVPGRGYVHQTELAGAAKATPPAPEAAPPAATAAAPSRTPEEILAVGRPREAALRQELAAQTGALRQRADEAGVAEDAAVEAAYATLAPASRQFSDAQLTSLRDRLPQGPQRQALDRILAGRQTQAVQVGAETVLAPYTAPKGLRLPGAPEPAGLIPELSSAHPAIPMGPAKPTDIPVQGVAGSRLLGMAGPAAAMAIPEDEDTQLDNHLRTALLAAGVLAIPKGRLTFRQLWQALRKPALSESQWLIEQAARRSGFLKSLGGQAAEEAISPEAIQTAATAATLEPYARPHGRRDFFRNLLQLPHRGAQIDRLIKTADEYEVSDQLSRAWEAHDQYASEMAPAEERSLTREIEDLERRVADTQQAVLRGMAPGEEDITRQYADRLTDQAKAMEWRDVEDPRGFPIGAEPIYAVPATEATRPRAWYRPGGRETYPLISPQGEVEWLTASELGEGAGKALIDDFVARYVKPITDAEGPTTLGRLLNRLVGRVAGRPTVDVNAERAPTTALPRVVPPELASTPDATPIPTNGAPPKTIGGSSLLATAAMPAALAVPEDEESEWDSYVRAILLGAGAIGMAKAAKGGLTLGVDTKMMASIMGNQNYTKPTAEVITRELVQNARDAVLHVPEAQKSYTVRFGALAQEIPEIGIPATLYPDGRTRRWVEVHDTGPGMSKKELFTVFTNLWESGKRNDPDAAGGKGMAKVAFLAAPEAFEGESVTREAGQLVRHTFAGNLEMILDTKQGVPVTTTVLADGPGAPPTGLRFRAHLKEDQTDGLYNAEQWFTEFFRYSPDPPKNVKFIMGGIEQYPKRDEALFGAGPKDTALYDDEEIRLYHNEPDLFRGEGDTYVRVRVANNGVYQFPKEWSNTNKAPWPDTIVLDIRPRVPEDDPRYSFTNSREDVQHKTLQRMKAIVDKLGRELAKQGGDKRVQQYQDLFHPFWHAGRQYYIGGMDGRATQQDLLDLTADPDFPKVLGTIASVFNDVLHTVAADKPDWLSSLDRIGIVLDPDVRGVWVPVPQANPNDPPRYSLFINPMVILKSSDYSDPVYAAAKMLDTVVHEVAHSVSLSNPFANHTSPWWQSMGFLRSRTGPIIDRLQKRIYSAIVQPGSPGYHAYDIPLAGLQSPATPAVRPSPARVNAAVDRLLQWYGAYAQRPSGSPAAFRATVVPDPGSADFGGGSAGLREHPAADLGAPEPGAAGPGGTVPPAAAAAAPGVGPGAGSGGAATVGTLSSLGWGTVGALYGFATPGDDESFTGRLRSAALWGAAGAGLGAGAVGLTNRIARRGSPNAPGWSRSVLQPEDIRRIKFLERPSAGGWRSMAEAASEELQIKFRPFHQLRESVKDPRFAPMRDLFQRTQEKESSFQNVVRDLRARVTQNFKEIMQPLKLVDDVNVFKAILFHQRDAFLLRRQMAANPQGPVPLTEAGLTADQAQARADALLLDVHQRAPHIEQALNAHNRVMAEIGQELVARHWISPTVLEEQVAYFPHYVMDYLDQELGTSILTGSIRTRRSGARYLKAEGGPWRTVHDYGWAVERYLMSMYADMARYDAEKSIVMDYDLLHGRVTVPTPQGPRQMRPRLPADELMRKGVYDRLWSDVLVPDGWVLHEVRGRDPQHLEVAIIPEPIHAELMRQGQQPGDINKLLIRGTEAWKAGILNAMWGAFTTTNLAGDVTRFYQFPYRQGTNPIEQTLWLKDAGKALRYWTKVRNDPTALQSLSPEALLLYEWAKLVLPAPGSPNPVADVGAGAATAEMGGQAFRNPKLRRLLRPQYELNTVWADPQIRLPDKLKYTALVGIRPVADLANYPLYFSQLTREYAELWPRMAKFMEVTDRIAREQGVSGSRLSRGLTPDRPGAPDRVQERARVASEITRHIMVDYGKLTPFERTFLRGIHIPFYTFYKHNTVSYLPGLSKRLTADPATLQLHESKQGGAIDAVGALGRGAIGLATAQMVWNENILPKVVAEYTGDPANEDRVRRAERSLPDWQKRLPHVTLPWITVGKNGEQRISLIFVGMQTPAQAAYGMLGMAGLTDRARDFLQDEATVREKVEQFGADWFAQWKRNWFGMVNPLYQAGLTLSQGQDPRTGQDVAPPTATIEERLAGAAASVGKSVPLVNIGVQAAGEGEGPAANIKTLLKHLFIGGSKMVTPIEDIEARATITGGARAKRATATETTRNWKEIGQFAADAMKHTTPEQLAPLYEGLFQRGAPKADGTPGDHLYSVDDRKTAMMLIDTLNARDRSKWNSLWLRAHELQTLDSMENPESKVRPRFLRELQNAWR